MPAYRVPESDFARIFGPPDDLDGGPPGRARKCRTCGGWHRTDQPWPHNCRPPAPPRNPDLAMPQLAPAFQPFKAGDVDRPETIGDRTDKREYMKRHDLVEFDEGVGKRNEWVEEYETRREIVADLKRFHETDPLNLSPEQKGLPMGDDKALDGAPEIDTTDMEIIK